MAVAKRHRHKYYLGTLNSNRVWTCALPDCNHYMPTHMSSMVNGKNAYCWGCDAEITLNPQNMKDDHPKCVNCIAGISPEEVVTESLPMSEAMKSFLEGKL